MTDIEQIIASFQGVERPEILSSTQTDLFLTLVSKKEHWTQEEYNQVRVAYDLNYMSNRVMDYFLFHKIKLKYKFERTWSEYFQILDAIKDIKKQAQYINYYIWYYGSTMNEAIYLELETKPYFKYILSKNKIKFLKSYIHTHEKNYWVKEKFTPREIKFSLTKNNLYVQSHTNLDDLKDFYTSYKPYMTQDVKNNLFYSVVQRGSLEMMEFLYPEVKINKMRLICHVGADTAPKNTLEIMHFLMTLGVGFRYQDLLRARKRDSWWHLEYKTEITHFFEAIKAEKIYHYLDKQLDTKTENSMVNKI